MKFYVAIHTLSKLNIGTFKEFHKYKTAFFIYFQHINEKRNEKVIVAAKHLNLYRPNLKIRNISEWQKKSRNCIETLQGRICIPGFRHLSWNTFKTSENGLICPNRKISKYQVLKGSNIFAVTSAPQNNPIYSNF